MGSGGGWNSTGVGDTCRVRAPRGGRQGHAWGVGRPRVGCGGAELWGLGSGMGWGAVPQIGAVGEGSLFGSGLYGEWGHAWGGGGLTFGVAVSPLGGTHVGHSPQLLRSHLRGSPIAGTGRTPHSPPSVSSPAVSSPSPISHASPPHSHFLGCARTASCSGTQCGGGAWVRDTGTVGGGDDDIPECHIPIVSPHSHAVPPSPQPPPAPPHTFQEKSFRKRSRCCAVCRDSVGAHGLLCRGDAAPWPSGPPSPHPPVPPSLRPPIPPSLHPSIPPSPCPPIPTIPVPPHPHDVPMSLQPHCLHVTVSPRLQCLHPHVPMFMSPNPRLPLSHVPTSQRPPPRCHPPAMGSWGQQR